MECGVKPIAPHLYFPQFLDDERESERDLGIQMGLSLLKGCSQLWYFGDTVTMGMKHEIDEANRLGIPVRHIPETDIQYDRNGGMIL
jgi:hypothetical protein